MIWVSPGGACPSDLDGCCCDFGINCSCWRRTERDCRRRQIEQGRGWLGRMLLLVHLSLLLVIWVSSYEPHDLMGYIQIAELSGPWEREEFPGFSGFTAGALLGSTTQVLIVQQVCVLVAQSCLTLCNHRDCSPPGSSVHGLLQARILEWVAFPSPGDLPDPGIEPESPSLQADSLQSESPRKSQMDWLWIIALILTTHTF